MGSIKFAAPPATQVDATPRFTQGVTVHENDGSSRVYIRNADTSSFAAGDPVVSTTGPAVTEGIKASSGDDGEPERLLGFAAATIAAGEYGWAWRSGPSVLCAVAPGGVDIAAGSSLTLRFVSGLAGLGIIPTAVVGVAPRTGIAWTAAVIASTATTARVLLSMPSA